MAVDSTYYLVSQEIAMRGGDIANRYRAEDGRFIVSARYLKRITLQGEEYLTGLQGIEPITEEESEALISANGFKKGLE